MNIAIISVVFGIAILVVFVAISYFDYQNYEKNKHNKK